MMIHQNPSKLLIASDNDKYLLMTIKRASIARLDEDDFSRR
jgi:hypothetical protein